MAYIGMAYIVMANMVMACALFATTAHDRASLLTSGRVAAQCRSIRLLRCLGDTAVGHRRRRSPPDHGAALPCRRVFPFGGRVPARCGVAAELSSRACRCPVPMSTRRPPKRPLPYYVVMAYVVMAYVVMAYVGMAYIVMAYVVMAYVVTTYIAIAHEVMACMYK